ncbi:MAG: GNAT family N-acetyltransferase [Polyangiaceae bacterium]
MENRTSARHRVTEVEDPHAFAREARPFFQVDEVRSTIALTTLDGVLAGVWPGARLYRVDAEPGAAEEGRGARDEGRGAPEGRGSPVLFALQTPPFPLVVARGEVDAVEALGAYVAAGDPNLPGVTGPVDAARAFVRGAARATSREVAHEKIMRLYTCREVIPPARPPSGGARLATPEDLDVIVPMFEAFSADVRVPLPPSRPAAERAIREARLFVWKDRGAIVSMTQRTLPAGRCTRVNLVYTPRAARGHGYASALVAHVTETVLREAPGAFACLFTDLENATSNAIYQAVGYTAVTDYAELRFG